MKKTYKKTKECVRIIYENKLFYLFLTPLFILILLFGIWPIVKSIQMSFTQSATSLSNNPIYVGFDNYIQIFKDSYFIDSLKITVLFTIISVPLNICIAFLYALMLSSDTLNKGRVLFKLAVFIPVITPDVVGAIIWKWMYNSDFGAINSILRILHLPEFGGISSTNTVLIALMLVELWKHVGFYVIIFLTNLQLIDKSMFEAADIEGATYLQKIRYLIIPDLRPAFTINLVYAMIQFLKTFTVAMVMTQGGPNYKSNFISFYAYNKFSYAKYGEATAMATVLFLIVIVLSAIMYKLNREEA